jgi:hypothetical protein
VTANGALVLRGEAHAGSIPAAPQPQTKGQIMWWYKGFYANRFYVHYGVQKGIAIGFSVDRYHLMLDLGIFWIGIEW